ncbi:hypothetical protein KIN20_026851 [Parelaphostrongylus tenuis]|uniref:Uncharacterized protein n=1 Tax=Parelaphostrongylus tenuis TaxID=148309 RepID=A0AAD5QYL3_PARTN|nr:hypothetical protein KIN20_026851 [Parelaphostrongylus tenuis]
MSAGQARISERLFHLAFDVLERQGRGAFLSDGAISSILGQLRVQITYTELNCRMSVKPEDMLGSQI